METITTSKGEFVVVELPHGHIVYEFNGKYYDLESGKVICDSKHFKLICKLSEVTEDDAKLIVDEPEICFNPANPYCVDDIVYPNYLGEYKFWFATQSLHSLLKSKGIDINNGNWYLFKKV